ncbi:MAG: hypothetical protein ACI9MC_001057 [Kiritimatiellia bacterium]|jgi:hypothetical protein
MRTWALVLALMVALPAVASNAASVRLEHEMERLAQRNAWSGVERAFADLEATGEDPSTDALLLGAEAARFLGDAMTWRGRLLRAATAGAEVKVQLDQIDANFAGAHIYGPLTRGAQLQRMSMPFDPDLRRAIVYAQEQVATSRDFTGLLPLGHYTINGQDLEIVGGAAQQQVLIPRPEGGPGGRSLTWSGPVFSAGALYQISSAPRDGMPDPQYGMQAQGQTVLGAVVALEAGWTVGLTRKSGLFAVLGYQAMPSGTTVDAAMPASMHSGSVAAGLAVRAGPMLFTAGPSWRVVSSRGTGVHEPFQLDPSGTWDEQTNRWSDNSIEWRGLSLAPGARIGADLLVVDMDRTAMSVGLRAGIAADGARTFGEAGVQIGLTPKLRDGQ